MSKDHSRWIILLAIPLGVSTKKQLATDALWCLYNSLLSKVEPKNFKSVITEDCWFQAMQDKIHEFDRLQVTAYAYQKAHEALKRSFGIKTHEEVRRVAQFLGDKLVSWSSKKQKSTCELNYKVQNTLPLPGMLCSILG
ncbi:hypothetical protein Tco_0598631 [Tanacetum coccineum]